jgi:hypothetical protein
LLGFFANLSFYCKKLLLVSAGVVLSSNYIVIRALSCYSDIGVYYN